MSPTPKSPPPPTNTHIPPQCSLCSQSRERRIRFVIRQSPSGKMETDRHRSDLPGGLVPTLSACGCHFSSPTFLGNLSWGLFQAPTPLIPRGQSPVCVFPQHRAHWPQLPTLGGKVQDGLSEPGAGTGNEHGRK